MTRASAHGEQRTRTRRFAGDCSGPMTRSFHGRTEAVMGVDLSGRVALVAGATRGAGRAIAVELARAGAFVYATGRSTRAARSEIDRPETIEDTGDLMASVGEGVAVVVDHEDPAAVAALVERIEAEQ